MIKMSGKNRETGRGIIVLGIDAKNVERLKQGHPIHVVADDLGFKGDIVIHYRETIAELEKEFAPLIGPETRVSDSRKDKRN